jgi:hypothetical protein
VKKKDRFLPFVEVTWRDSYSVKESAWTSMEEADESHLASKKSALCTSIGAVVKRDKIGLTLAMSMTAGGQVGGLWHIPAGMVVKVRRLRKR